MFKTGRICMKIAGRDAGKYCVVLSKEKDNYVMIDGQTRRRKCNTAHLEPTDKTISISENAEHSEVVKALGEAGFKVAEKRSSKEKKKKSQRPRKQKIIKEKPVKQVKEKKADKKQAKKEDIADKASEKKTKKEE